MKVVEIDIRDYNNDPAVRDSIKNWRDLKEHQREKATVHVSINNENMLDNFGNRASRPWKVWKPIVVAALNQAGVKFDHLSWSRKAGCECGCSPGFILKDEDGGNYHGKTIWITLDAAPVVTDEGVELAENRKSQLVRQLAAEAGVPVVDIPLQGPPADMKGFPTPKGLKSAVEKFNESFPRPATFLSERDPSPMFHLIATRTVRRTLVSAREYNSRVQTPKILGSNVDINVLYEQGQQIAGSRLIGDLKAVALYGLPLFQTEDYTYWIVGEETP